MKPKSGPLIIATAAMIGGICGIAAVVVALRVLLGGVAIGLGVVAIYKARNASGGRGVRKRALIGIGAGVVACAIGLLTLTDLFEAETSDYLTSCVAICGVLLLVGALMVGQRVTHRWYDCVLGGIIVACGLEWSGITPKNPQVFTCVTIVGMWPTIGAAWLLYGRSRDRTNRNAPDKAQPSE